MERIRFRAVDLVLLLLLLTPLGTAFGGMRAPKLAETVDLPSDFDLDFKLAATGRVEFSAQTIVYDDVASQVGAEVFQSLVKTQMISGSGLPYLWTFRLYNSPAINASSLPDGEVEAYTGIARLLGTNHGLWAAVLAHEIAHVARRHGIRKYLFHQYVEEQVRYWQMRARLGDRGAGWTALAVRIAGNLAEKKLSRDLEHDADMQGMLLMARAGYHPDYAFAMHHLLRMNSSERSKVGTFFFSDHPRWESRDQRTERAYTEALFEYNRLWASPDTSPGGAPPAVAFLGEVRGIENKEGGTGDLSLPLSCRRVGKPVALVIHLTRGNGVPVQSMVSDYRDSAGRAVIREHASCLDSDSARPTIVHIPTAIIPGQDRKLKAQVEVLGLNDEVLERSKIFDVRFPKIDRKATAVITSVRVEPEPDEPFGAKKADQYTAANAAAPVAIHAQKPGDAAPLAATRVEQPNLEVETVTVATRTKDSAAGIGVALVPVHPELPERDRPPSAPNHETLGVLPTAVNRSGIPSNWKNSLTPTSPATWWQVSPSANPALKIGLSRLAISFPVQQVDTDSLPASVIVTNNTPEALTVLGMRILGSDSTDFTQINDCGRTIAAGGSCTLTIVFRPRSNGTRRSTLMVDGNPQEIKLTGIGK
jgi:hypothetical protein